jgi:hypothetical protein
MLLSLSYLNFNITMSSAMDIPCVFTRSRTKLLKKQNIKKIRAFFFKLHKITWVTQDNTTGT